MNATKTALIAAFVALTGSAFAQTPAAQPATTAAPAATTAPAAATPSAPAASGAKHGHKHKHGHKKDAAAEAASAPKK